MHWTGRMCRILVKGVRSPAKTARITSWVKVQVLAAQSCPTLGDLMDCSPQAPPSMEFSRQEHCNVLPFPSPKDPPDPGIEPVPLALQVDSLLSEPPD